jgi:uncharacterized integral membrane protein
MSAFTLFALLLLAVATMFALANPDRVMVRFLMWHLETTVALAVVGGSVLGGFLVFISQALAHRRMRAQIRDLQMRLSSAEQGRPGPGPAPPPAS